MIFWMQVPWEPECLCLWGVGCTCFFSILSQGEGKRKCLLNEHCWRRVDYDAYLFCTVIHLCWISLNENGVTSAFVTDVKCLLLSAVPLLLYMFVTLLFHPRVLARFLYEKCIRQLKSTPGFSAFLSCPFFHFTFPNNSFLPTAHQCLVLLQKTNNKKKNVYNFLVREKNKKHISLKISHVRSGSL